MLPGLIAGEFVAGLTLKVVFLSSGAFFSSGGDFAAAGGEAAAPLALGFF